MKKKQKRKYTKTFTKKDEKHYKIYKYLDELLIPNAYIHATAILERLDS